MDADAQLHIFEPFFTTETRGHGAGMGLATVYGIVKESGGYIWVYSERGKGTTFEVYLPRTEEAASLDVAVEPIAQSLIGPETVLVVEDQPMLRELIQRMLASSGYTVLPVEEPAEALSTARTYTGPIHVVLTDVIMPRMNGRALIDQFVQVRPGIKSTFLSGYPEDIVERHRELRPPTTLLASHLRRLPSARRFERFWMETGTESLG